MKLLFVSILLMTGQIINAQGSTTKNADSVQFRFKNYKVIEMQSLKDGDHSYFSNKGYKMVLVVKDHKIIDQVFYNNQGVMVAKRSLPSDLKNGGKDCQVCVMVKYPNGSQERVCTPVACPTAQGISNSLD